MLSMHTRKIEKAWLIGHSQFFNDACWKRDSLGGEITCSRSCNCFVQHGIEPYTDSKTEWAVQSALFFITTGLPEYLEILQAVSLLWLWIQIGVQSSSIHFRTFCTLLTVMLIKYVHSGWIHDLTTKNRSRNTLWCLFVRFVYGSTVKRVHFEYGILSAVYPG